MQLSCPSRITSYSISFQPATERSINTWPIIEYFKPLMTVSINSSSFSAIPPPVPPRVYAGLTIIGYPISFAKSTAPWTSSTIALSGIGSPIACVVSLNISRSSAFLIASRDVPNNSTLNFSKAPLCASCTAKFKPACPPRVASKPSGLSFSMIAVKKSTVSGSI